MTMSRWECQDDNVKMGMSRTPNIDNQELHQESSQGRDEDQDNLQN